jgi:hypothetical protein
MVVVVLWSRRVIIEICKNETELRRRLYGLGWVVIKSFDNDHATYTVVASEKFGKSLLLPYGRTSTRRAGMRMLRETRRLVFKKHISTS